MQKDLFDEIKRWFNASAKQDNYGKWLSMLIGSLIFDCLKRVLYLQKIDGIEVKRNESMYIFAMKKSVLHGGDLMGRDEYLQDIP